MSWIEALILGIIQGLTEFLPVSSSGHLAIGQALLHTNSADDLTFTVAVHVATVLATIVVFRKQIWGLLRGVFGTVKWNTEKDYTAKLLLSMIPIFVVGMFFKNEVEGVFGSGLKVVGICLLITALLLWLSETISKRRNGQGKEVTYMSSFIIGLAQACAVLPGLSRSGTTIATGLLCGVKKESVAQFSFLMVLIPILGEAFLDVIDIAKGEAITTSVSTVSLLVGFVAAFFVGLVACKFMLAIIRKQKLTWFALYCFIVGLLTLGMQQTIG